jgi:hypothetical protein
MRLSLLLLVVVSAVVCVPQTVEASPLCTMKSEVVSTAASAGLKFEVLASRQLCVVPTESQNLWAYAAQLRITNTTTLPIEFTHNGGSMAKHSFLPVVMDKTRKNEEWMPSHPADPATATVERVHLAPGASHVLLGDPTYMMTPIRVAVAQPHQSREFAVDFKASILVARGAETERVEVVLPTELTVFVKR